MSPINKKKQIKFEKESEDLDFEKEIKKDLANQKEASNALFNVIDEGDKEKMELVQTQYQSMLQAKQANGETVNEVDVF